VNITDEKFASIIKQNEDRLKHLCRVYADRKADEEDLFQEILIQAWRSLPSFDGKASIDTWLYRLAVNTAISFVRKRKTRQNYYDDYKKEQSSQPQDRHMPHHSDNEQLDKIYEAISTLNASEKAIITMYLEDFSYAEISYVADITENYVGVKLNRIKKKLSNKIDSSNGTG